MYSIIDNYLSEDIYKNIAENIESLHFPWFWIPYQVDPDTNSDTDSPFFTHIFYQYDKPSSSYYELLNPLYKKMGIQSGKIQVKANLIPKQIDGTRCNTHCDTFTKTLFHQTSIFYIGTNNGKTVLCLPEGEIEFPSIANRLLTFNADIPHYVKYQTDVDRRIVINMNYVHLG